MVRNGITEYGVRDDIARASERVGPHPLRAPVDLEVAG
jgi:hypothetical protein